MYSIVLLMKRSNLVPVPAAPQSALDNEHRRSPKIKDDAEPRPKQVCSRQRQHERSSQDAAVANLAYRLDCRVAVASDSPDDPEWVGRRKSII